jgi:hypothetical protein
MSLSKLLDWEMVSMNLTLTVDGLRHEMVGKIRSREMKQHTTRMSMAGLRVDLEPPSPAFAPSTSSPPSASFPFTGCFS